MSIENFLTRLCKQTAVYWGNPTNNGEGGFTFDEAVEIYCRWEEGVEIMKDVNGKEKVSMAQVYLLQDVDEQGYLYLGDLDDLDSNPDDPMEVDGAYQIMKFAKTPALGRTDDFLRKAYL